MTFKSEHDIKFKTELALLVLSTAAVSVWAFDGNLLALMAALPLGVVTLVCAMQLFATSYTLGSDLLTAKSGLSRVSVAYKDITLVTDKKDAPAAGYVPLATASHKLYIFYTQDDKSYRLELSPLPRAEFVKALDEKL